MSTPSENAPAVEQQGRVGRRGPGRPRKTTPPLTPPDTRHPLNRAWDEWLRTEWGKLCLREEILKRPAEDFRYLLHRLEAAFVAGAKAAEQIAASQPPNVRVLPPRTPDSDLPPAC